MSFYENRKAVEGLTIGKIITMLLVLIVIIAGFIGIYTLKEESFDWIRNLPGFTKVNETEFDITKLAPDELVNYGFVCADSNDKVVAILGEKPQGGVLGQTRYDIRNIYILSQDRKALIKANFQAEITNYRKYIIEIEKTGKNIELGNVTNNIVQINKSMFDSPLLQKYVINIDNLRMIDGAKTPIFRVFCKSETQIQATSQEVQKKMEEIIQRGISNRLTLVFHGGALGIADIADLYWSFDQGKPLMSLKPNGDFLDCRNPANTDRSCYDITTTDEDVNRVLQDKAVLSRMNSRDVQLLHDIMWATTPASFSERIKEVILFQWASIDNNKQYNVPVESINQVLYGINIAPEQLELEQEEQTEEQEEQAGEQTENE